MVITSTDINVYANGNSPVTSAVTMSAIRKLQLFAPGVNSDCLINYVLIYPGLAATAAQICSYYKDVKNESILFNFQQGALGRTRCDVSDYLRSYNWQAIDGYRAATASTTFQTKNGELADDQYADYAPESGSYNGLVAQKYMTQSLGLTLDYVSRQKAQALNDGTRRYYASMDYPLPDYPDTASPTYFQNAWSTVDGWTANAAPPLTVSGGYLEIAGNQQYAYKAYNINALTVKVKITATAADVYYLGYRRSPAGTYNLTAASITLAAGATGILEYTGTEATDILYIGHGTTEAATNWCKIDWIYIGTGIYASLLIDDSGNGWHGAINGATPISNGMHGYGFSFDGVDDNINCGDMAFPTGAMTLAFWAKTSTDGRHIMGKFGAAGQYSFIAAVGSLSVAKKLNILLSVDGTATAAFAGSTDIDDGAWHRHVIAYTPSTSIVFYLDGRLDVTRTTSVPAAIFDSTAALTLGLGSANYYLGYLDEVGADARTWSSSDAANDYAYQTGKGFALTTDSQKEQLFYGTIDRGGFSRTTSYNTTSTFSANADDLIKRIARKKVRSSRTWADYYLSRATPASNSLWHEYVELATAKETYNYLGNSSFGNDPETTSWNIGGVAPSFVRDGSVSINGSYAGYLSGTSGLYIYQTASMGVSVGNILTLQVYAYSLTAQTVNVRIREYADAVAGSTTVTSNSHGGNGWELLSVTHTVIDSTTNKIYCALGISGTECRFDAAMLSYGGLKYFYVLNPNNGSGGEIDESLATLGTYSLLGHVAEDVAYQHDWAVIKRGESPWEKIKALCDACLARFMHISPAGVLHFASYLATADETTSRGDIGNIYGLGKENQPIIANRITVEGVYIDVRGYPQIVWTADGSSVGNESTDGSTFTVSLADDEYYPDNTILPGGIECLYEDRKPGE
jgi:hypothetical protein